SSELISSLFSGKHMPFFFCSCGRLLKRNRANRKGRVRNPLPLQLLFFCRELFRCSGGKRKIENRRRRQIRAETCRRGEERDVGFALFLCRQAVAGVGLFYGLVCFGGLNRS